MLATDLLADAMYKRYESEVLPGPAYNTNFLITMLHVESRLARFSPRRVDISRYRRLQILRAIFHKSETEATPLSNEFAQKLDPAELQWVGELMSLGERVKQGDDDAAAELRRIQVDTAMHGRAATLKELDVGSFAVLPELFTALKLGTIKHA